MSDFADGELQLTASQEFLLLEMEDMEGKDNKTPEHPDGNERMKEIEEGEKGSTPPSSILSPELEKKKKKRRRKGKAKNRLTDLEAEKKDVHGEPKDYQRTALREQDVEMDDASGDGQTDKETAILPQPQKKRKRGKQSYQDRKPGKMSHSIESRDDSIDSPRNGAQRRAPRGRNGRDNNNYVRRGRSYGSIRDAPLEIIQEEIFEDYPQRWYAPAQVEEVVVHDVPLLMPPYVRTQFVRQPTREQVVYEYASPTPRLVRRYSTFF